MPTIKLAIEEAAWECLARLQFLEGVMHMNRAFRFLPTRDPENRSGQILTRGETDPAVVGQATYIAAMTMLHTSVSIELEAAMLALADARLQWCQGKRPPTFNPSGDRHMGLLIPDAGPSQPSPKEDRPQLSQQVQELIFPNLADSMAGEVTQVRHQLRASDLILRGVPLVRIPEEGEDVDTTLRLSLTPPDASGH